MKRENDEITDLFRSRLGHAEMTVRESFWEELNEDVAACCQQRRRVLFFRVAAAASVLLVLAASSAAFGFSHPKRRWRKHLHSLLCREWERWMAIGRINHFHPPGPNLYYTNPHRVKWLYCPMLMKRMTIRYL